ncbi:MAG: alpha/beta hydrolase [Pseudomonadota bacterium]|nr:alpha/beta hydrolase [Pseudomonadota bacterium]
MTNYEDIRYHSVDGHMLEGRLYRPQSPNGKWLVDVHGGAWGSGDRLNNAVIHVDLAANGVGVFALDFRLSDVADYPIPVQDVSWGVRWFKANLRTLGIHASMIGGLASSSGAQQLGLVALSPDGEDWTVEAPEMGEVDSSLDFFVAGWPIFDPLRRYHLMRQTKNDRLIAAHDAYFANEVDMEDGNPHRLLERGEATHLPPMLIIQGTNDANVEHTWQDEFIDLYRSNGGNAEIRKFAGQAHTFVTIDPETEASKAAIAAIREFVLSA